MRYTKHLEYGFALEVSDDLLTDGTAAVEIINRKAPGLPVVWREAIRIAQDKPGLPVMHTRADGREVCFGGPSHTAMAQARSRADFLLEGRTKEGLGALYQLAIVAARDERARRRNCG